MKKNAIVYGVMRDLQVALSNTLSSVGIDTIFVCVKGTLNCSQESNNSANCIELEAKLDGELILDPLIRYVDGRSIDYMILAPTAVQPVKKLLDVNYFDWRRCTYLNLDVPLFLTLKLFRAFTEEARVLYLFNDYGFIPTAGKGPYSTAQFALRMAINILSSEEPDALIASASIASDENINIGNKEVFSPNKDSKLHPTGSLDTADFLTWLLTKSNGQDFQEKPWNIEETSHHRHWLRPKK